MFRQNIKQNKGFTLVEMMVAIAVFSVVMVVATSALLSIIDSNQKAQSIKTAINTINFALEGISKDVRVGNDYACISKTNEVISRDCTNGTVGFRYRSNRAYQDPTTKIHQFAYYRFNEDLGEIESCLETEPNQDCLLNNNFVSLTSRDEIKIEKMNFYVLGLDSLDGLRHQPRLVIVLEGLAGSKQKTQTRFDLQTTVSQRIRTN